MTRGGAAAARVAHNHEVAGSSPAPATKIRLSSKDGSFILVEGQIRAKRFVVCEHSERRSDEQSEGSAVLPPQPSVIFYAPVFLQGLTLLLIWT
jgi:hypothetical protein